MTGTRPRWTHPLGTSSPRFSSRSCHMALDQAAQRSRRAILAAGFGGLAASVAAAFGRPLRVRAGSDGDLVLAAVNDVAAATDLICSTAGTTVLFVEASGTGVALVGQSAGGSGVRGV